MIALSKKSKVVTLLTLAGIVASVGLISFTEICNLQAVTLNGEKVEKWDKKLSLVPNKSILQQPFEDFVEISLADEETLKLDYRYAWPHTLLVRLNSISPDGLILDKNSAALFGLDKNGRIIPLKSEVVDWERPVFTGVKASKMYQCPTDLRVRKVLTALGKVRSERVNFYRLIEQVDFNSKDYVEVSLAGHEHTVRLRAEFFYEDIIRYLDFVARFRPALDGIKVIDLRQDGQIITKGKKA